MIILYMSFMGKTQITHLTPVDFIGNFILGGIVGGVLYNQDISFIQYIVLLIIGLAIIALLNWVAKRFDVFRDVAIGNPLPIIKDGKFILSNLSHKKNKIDMGIISSMMHAQGIKSFQEISYAQIEPNGQLSIIKKGDDSNFSLILICNGCIQCYALDILNKDEAWLLSEMKKQNIDAIEKIFIAEYWNGKTNFVLVE